MSAVAWDLRVILWALRQIEALKDFQDPNAQDLSMRH